MKDHEGVVVGSIAEWILDSDLICLDCLNRISSELMESDRCSLHHLRLNTDHEADPAS